MTITLFKLQYSNPELLDLAQRLFPDNDFSTSVGWGTDYEFEARSRFSSAKRAREAVKELKSYLPALGENNYLVSDWTSSVCGRKPLIILRVE